MVDYRTGMDPPTTDLPTPRRVLAVGAHPDDAEFGAAATMAKWAARGAHITLLVLTDGSKGSWDPNASPAELARTRAEEQRRAAEAMGVADTFNLGYVDGELEYSMALRAEVCGWIRRTRPDILLSHDPWRRYMLHPDHRATGWAVVDGVVAARDHLFFPEQLKDGITHHRPAALLLWAADRPDHREDVEGFVERKVEALLAHSSQATTTMDDAGLTKEATESFRAEIHSRARAAGVATGLAEAEEFKRITP
ncbi:MAG: PIG-L family deacetylase [bacterium]|nr:PIG-L family deacetylase [bacterium]MDE0289304.1 PIG-L family deacetylase [bacterium]MDE0440286.1 PIG-L family deacetylase [bacterium]